MRVEAPPHSAFGLTGSQAFYFAGVALLLHMQLVTSAERGVGGRGAQIWDITGAVFCSGMRQLLASSVRLMVVYATHTALHVWRG